MKRRTPTPSAPQAQEPPKLEDGERLLPPGTTQYLEPWIVRDPDIVKQTRRDANEKRKLAAQLHNKVLAAIYGHLDRHPDASNNDIAGWVKGDPETGPLVAHLKTRSLADKIGDLRK